MDQTIIIPIVLALTEITKQFGVTGKYAVLVSIGFGVAFGLLVNLSIEGGVTGLILGLSAAGVYDVGKKVILGK